MLLLEKAETLKDIVLHTSDGVQLTNANSLKSRGVILDPVLSLEKKVNTVARRAFLHLSLA